MKLFVDLQEQGYDIVIERGALNNLDSYLDLNRKALIVTDSGVPEEYSKKVLELCKDGYIVTIPQGEKSKSFDTYKMLLEYMVEKSFTRTDCVVAVGGGVVGDLSGFVASSYMRGVDFYNIPTTLLSQLDSSIGGKVAIDLLGVKNIVGAFYQPKKVIIDSNTLKTLDKRQISAGLAEGIKMSATFDKELFEFIENSQSFDDDIDIIIEKSLRIKKYVVENDPKEKGLRRVLNFGHTIGHAIESDEQLGNLLHGECVALGMLPLSSLDVRERLKRVLEKYNLPTKIDTSSKRLMSYIMRDKKAKGEMITVIYVEKLGTFEMKDIKITEIKDYIDGGIL
ncbi:MAG: 3-dehydroquinate synthase [Clostridia bacterium]|nr:3-dehydroquinate synthase [Clostridia bacterium]MBQ7789448.1 3-dehydroquinate synthase [Clostridia bacterium]